MKSKLDIHNFVPCLSYDEAHIKGQSRIKQITEAGLSILKQYTGEGEDDN